jgi:hypothetical protein
MFGCVDQRGRRQPACRFDPLRNMAMTHESLPGLDPAAGLTSRPDFGQAAAASRGPLQRERAPRAR